MAINRAIFLRLLQQHRHHSFASAPPPSLQTCKTPIPSTSATLARTRSASLSSSASDPQDPHAKSPGIFSWLNRIKGAFTGTAPPQPVVESPPISSAAQPSSPAGDFSLIKFADEIKKARRFGGLLQFGKGLPRGGEVKVTQSLDRQESIVRALACHDPTGQHLDAKQKAEVATQCGCTVKEVDQLLEKFGWTREAHRRVEQLRKEGKPLPKSWDQVEKLMGGSFKPDVSRSLGKTQEIGRNALCSCGSGKKYKRCCGRSSTQ